MSIEVQGVRRAFGDVLAVESISLRAEPGEVTALIGPNGSGKTTLLLMLATLLVPDQGQIRVDGLDPVTQPTQVRARIGWMPDGFGTWDALTVREVLLTIAAAYRIAPDRARTRTDELLHTVHLEDLADRRARVLSRGQKQRLGLARALINDPTVLLLDEPASGLDPRSRIELRDVLRGLAAQGKTVLVSSHILTELQEVADRAVIVARGRSLETQSLDGDFVAMGTASWRIDSLDPDRLTGWLVDHHVPARKVGGGQTEVEVAGEENAARLLADLVRDGIRVIGFTPSQGALESAYLAATEDRQ
ncbi:ABC-2 type transport system ATP-binding protein [Pedococcus dokdonensis]|uniref:ABC-2 type transport system ATP-binding protein n=1 Tax=Pedococcus dokdonensis TaxID=443156 RepID=A0A1H0UH10_9MICO|nr:ABC transporter ATP-binding protein [Pedococcus dokdonensis]SDP65305.1 ABC-2 type transport system ATP-binding protein [Pedococcus dokdonensis]